MAYLKEICDSFKYDGKTFDIIYKDRKIISGGFKGLAVIKVEYDYKDNIKNIEI